MMYHHSIELALSMSLCTHGSDYFVSITAHFVVLEELITVPTRRYLILSPLNRTLILIRRHSSILLHNCSPARLFSILLPTTLLFKRTPQMLVSCLDDNHAYHACSTSVSVEESTFEDLTIPRNGWNTR